MLVFALQQVRNEPCNVGVACEYVAKIKKLDVETVAEITSANALKLFPKLREFMSDNYDFSAG